MKGKQHKPTAASRRQVKAMAGCGVPQEDIARVLELDATTLRRHYRPELDRAVIVANAKVAGNLFRIATGEGREAVTAAIFWLKTRAGWSEFNLPARQPAPAQPKPTPLGKKEQAMLEANLPPEDPDWADLVPSRTPN